MFPIEGYLAEADSLREKTGRPLVTLSYAQSLDGSLTDQRGRPLRLSGEASMQLTHRLRAAHDAVLVGIGTLLADDPRLTVRLVDGPQPQPVILDSRLRTPPQALVFQHPILPLIATCHDASPVARLALEDAGARILTLPPDRNGQVNLEALLVELASIGINRLMVEGGAAVITSFLSARLADLLVLTLAPVYVGGLHAPETLVALDGHSDPRWPRLTDHGVQTLEGDIIIWGRISYDR